jgi:hypothetical protein
MTFLKNTQIKNFTKIRSVAPEIFRAYGEMDRHDKAIVAFRNFANVPKNCFHEK